MSTQPAADAKRQPNRSIRAAEISHGIRAGVPSDESGSRGRRRTHDMDGPFPEPCRNPASVTSSIRRALGNPVVAQRSGVR